MNMKRVGFTLMELLVVIVILSLLALLLFPVLGRVQERGREVKCASNLRQLHTATMSYISNHGGWLPHSASAQVFSRNHPTAAWPSVSTRFVTGWVESQPKDTVNMRSYWYGTNGLYCITNGVIFPYLGDRGDESVYVCPTMLLAARRTYPANNARSQLTRSYGMNNRVSNVEYQRIDGVSRVILFADQGFFSMPGKPHYLTLTPETASDSVPVINMQNLTVYYRRFYRSMDGSIDHARERYSDGAIIAQKADTQEYIGELHGNRPGLNRGTANVIFLDGHVERVVYTNTDSVCIGAWEYGRRVP